MAFGHGRVFTPRLRFVRFGRKADIRDRSRNVGSRRMSGRNSAESGPNGWNVTYLGRGTGNCADRRIGLEDGRRSVVKKSKIFFATKNLERTSLLSGLSDDLRPGKRLPPNLDRVSLFGTRAVLSG